ncbi:MAG TPA: prephenate dehydratase [Anaeromyxobacteraceae bacterium]|jgi:prephenate dehydratase|nr:prephenate dehydratase [Anaeromyxobacteraceae bacterium]
MRVAYLGPPGTFSEEALGRCDLTLGAEHVAYPSFADAYEAVARGEVDAALLPIENSLEGSVTATLDLLVHRPGLRIRREVLLAVEQQLMAVRGTRLADVKKVLSHPQPLGQCAAFLRERLRGVPQETTSSTAEAARLVAERKEGAAAIGPRAAAGRYGLEIIAENVQDADANTTRFVLVGHEDEAPTGRDKTSIAFTLDRDRPGGLYEILGELATRQINLSRIESRPMKQALGHYVFFIDFEGHRSEPRAAEAILGVLQRVHALHLLGSYPRAAP